jgi:hypothetical protein
VNLKGLVAKTNWLAVNRKSLCNSDSETPRTWRARSPYLYPPGTGWPGYIPRHWVPFSSPPTTHRATMEVFEPLHRSVYQTLRNKPHIRRIYQTPQQASYAQQEPHQTTYIPQIPIPPQQPNYTIHTSQAATTCRAPAQTEDFSEAEESIESYDNDDRLSWQAVRGRGKKRTGPRTTKLPTMKKNKPQETNKHPIEITITNTFEALRHTGTHRYRGQYQTKML